MHRNPADVTGTCGNVGPIHLLLHANLGDRVRESAAVVGQRYWAADKVKSAGNWRDKLAHDVCQLRLSVADYKKIGARGDAGQ